MKQNLLSGHVKIRGRKVPILWDGQHAQHVAENYIYKQSTHPVLHIPIQQVASKTKDWLPAGRRSYFGYGSVDGINIIVYIVLHANFAQITTAYKGKEGTMKTKSAIGKSKAIAQVVEESGHALDQEVLEEMVSDGVFENVEQARRVTNKHIYYLLTKNGKVYA